LNPQVRALLTLAALVGIVLGARVLAGGMAVDPGAEAALGFGCILIAAYCGGEITSAFKLPKLTGWLIAGFLFGPGIGHVFVGADHPAPFLTDPAVNTLGLMDDVAIGIIAFKGGGELRWSMVRSEFRTFAGVLAGHSLGASVFVGVTGWLLMPWLLPGLSGAEQTAAALLLGTVAVAKSPATTLAIRAECRARGPVADTALGVTVIADIFVALLFAVSAAVAATLVATAPGALPDPAVLPPEALAPGVDTVGGHPGAGPSLGLVLWEILGSLGAGVVVGGVLAAIIGKIKEELPAVLLAAAVGTMFFAREVHLSGLLVCMVAGFVVENFSTKGEELIEGLEHRTLPIFAIFFAIAGARIDVETLVAVGPLLLVIPAVRMLGIRVGTGLVGWAISAPPVVQKRIWTGLLGQAGMTLALAKAIADGFPAFGTKLETIILGVIAVNQVAGPILFRWALVKSGEVGAADRADGALAAH
jgi:Kef-type K+ transport system membrane component KefB